jgi:DNA-binding MarR family transcriptional regulator
LFIFILSGSKEGSSLKEMEPKELRMIELVNDVTRRVAKRYGPIAAEAGLSLTEAFALWIINRRPCKASLLADKLGLSPSTMTGILDRLETGGWLLREADQADQAYRRAVSLVATKKLTEYLRVAKRSVSKDLERSFKDLPPALVEGLCAGLEKVLEHLDADEATWAGACWPSGAPAIPWR